MVTPPSDQRSDNPRADKSPQDVERVYIADADSLARDVDSPASENGPLFHLMFLVRAWISQINRKMISSDGMPKASRKPS
jgi:hypothetical protein